MTTILLSLYDPLVLFIVFVAVVVLVVLYAPWNTILYIILWTLFIICMATWYYADEAWKWFKAWMKKPSKWEDNLPDLFI